MVLPRSLWLLSVCLLSWCCDARLLVFVDSRSKSTPLPMVIWSDKEDTKSVDLFKTFIENSIPGIYILSLEIEKSIKKDVENQVLDAGSQLCQILAQDPKLQQDYLYVAYSKGRQFISLGQKCPIPAMRGLISDSARKFLSDVKRIAQLY